MGEDDARNFFYYFLFWGQKQMINVCNVTIYLTPLFPSPILHISWSEHKSFVANFRQCCFDFTIFDAIFQNAHQNWLMETRLLRGWLSHHTRPHIHSPGVSDMMLANRAELQKMPYFSRHENSYFISNSYELAANRVTDLPFFAAQHLISSLTLTIIPDKWAGNKRNTIWLAG